MLPRERAARYQRCRMNPGTSEWWLIEKEFAALWPSLRPCLTLPKHPSKAGRPRTYDAHLSAEAILRLTYFNQPLREKLGHPYPSPCPLHRDLQGWVNSGALERFWRRLLSASSDQALAAWERAFRPERQPFQFKMGSRQAGQRRNQYWYAMMRHRLAEAVAKRAARRSASRRSTG